MTKEMHISSKEIALYHQSEVTRSRAQEIEMHLAGCSLCRQKFERFCGIVNALSEPDEEIVGLDLGADVQRSVRALPPAISRSRRLWPLFAGVAVASLLVLVTVVLFRYQESSGTLENCRDFRAKSAAPTGTEKDKWMGIQVYKVTQGEPVRIKDSLSGGSDLLVSYTNLGENPYEYLMVFAVDSEGEVYWLFPAYLEEGSDPRSIGIFQGRSQVELGEKIRHDFTPGPLVFYGVFTHRPLHVSTIESLVGEMIRSNQWIIEAPARLPVENAAQHLITTRVEP